MGSIEIMSIDYVTAYDPTLTKLRKELVKTLKRGESFKITHQNGIVVNVSAASSWDGMAALIKERLKHG